MKGKQGRRREGGIGHGKKEGRDEPRFEQKEDAIGRKDASDLGESKLELDPHGGGADVDEVASGKIRVSNGRRGQRAKGRGDGQVAVWAEVETKRGGERGEAETGGMGDEINNGRTPLQTSRTWKEAFGGP